MKIRLYLLPILMAFTITGIAGSIDQRRLSSNLLFDGEFSDPLNITWGFPGNNPGPARPGIIDKGTMLLTAGNCCSCMEQTILVPNGRYRLSARIRMQGMDETQKVTLKILETNREKLRLDIPNHKDSDWQTYYREFTVDGNEDFHRLRVVMSVEPVDSKEIKKSTGNVWFDALRLEPILSPQEVAALPSQVISGITGNGNAGLYMPGQPVTFMVSIRNLSATACPVGLEYEVNDYYERTIIKKELAAAIGGNASVLLQVVIPPPDKLGFYSVKFQLKTGGNRQYTAAERSFMVLKSMAGKSDPFWGLAMQRNGIVLAPAYELIGIGRIILPFLWRCEYQPGRYNWGETDRFISAYNRHGIQVIGATYETFLGDLPHRESQRIKALRDAGKNPLEPGSEHYRHYADFVRALVTRYHDRIKVWDIFNEIDGMAAAGNPVPVDYYVEKVKTFAQAAKSVDPTTRVVALEATSSDAKQGFPILKKMWQRLKNDVDAIWPHPYPVPRMLGPGKNVQNPEDNIRQYLTAAAKVGAPDGKTTMGISEIGYSIDKSLPLDGSEHKRMAELTARMMILARSVPGMEYFGYFLAIETPSDDPVHSYGLWENIYNNGDYFAPTADTVYPRPVLAAYATTARFLNRTIYSKMLKTDKNVYAFYFQREHGGVIALWGLGDGGNPIRMDIDLPYAVIAYDIMGNPAVTCPPGKQRLLLTSSPLFLVSPDNEGHRLSVSLEQAQTHQPQVAVAVRLQTLDKLAAKIRNRTRNVLPLTAWFGTQQQQLTLSPLAAIDTTFNLPPSQGLNPKQGKIIIRTSRTNYEFPFLIEPQPIYRKITAIQIDGDLREYQALKSLSLELLTPPDAKAWGTWENDADCSAEAWLLWDDQYLYLAVAAADDVHIQHETPRQMWKQDNLMLAVDTGNNAFPAAVSGDIGYDRDDSEFVFALNEDHQEKTYLWKNPFTPTGEKIPGVDFKAIRTGRETRYEIAIPWRTLTARTPQHGDVLGINVVVSDCDEGVMRQYWRGLTHGIHTAKDPSLYKLFVLMP